MVSGGEKIRAMPIYEYACTACGERTEAKQSFTDLPLETCEVCGGKLRKLYSPVGIVFKGSGFYSTDKGGKKGPSGSASAKEGSGSKKTETKSTGENAASSSTSNSSEGSKASSTSKSEKPAS